MRILNILQIHSWRDYFLALMGAALLAILVRTFILTAYKIPTASMEPTLKPGDFVFALRTAYASGHEPQRGDLVVFSYPNQPSTLYVKRVIGLPGDKIQIDKNQIIMNGQPFQYQKRVDLENESSSDIYDFITESDGNDHEWEILIKRAGKVDNFEPLIVAQGQYFLMGDNRENNDDSRYWGTVPTDQIQSKVIWVWFSVDWSHRWGAFNLPSVRWERVFSSVH